MSDSLNPNVDGLTVSRSDLPTSYTFRVTRYADVILRDAFPAHWNDLIQVLENFTIDLENDIVKPGGNRSPVAQRFDASLSTLGWKKQNTTIATRINDQSVSVVRGHEIDMFKLGHGLSFPGVAVEMEWNNKDPFFDRDLSNFYALHRARALAVGVIVTRGPDLQRDLGLLESQLYAGAAAKLYSRKYGSSTTHWAKLMARVDIGGECPLLLIGIGTARIVGLEQSITDYSTLDDDADEQ